MKPVKDKIFWNMQNRFYRQIDKILSPQVSRTIEGRLRFQVWMRVSDGIANQIFAHIYDIYN